MTLTIEATSNARAATHQRQTRRRYAMRRHGVERARIGVVGMRIGTNANSNANANANADSHANANGRGNDDATAMTMTAMTTTATTTTTTTTTTTMTRGMHTKAMTTISSLGARGGGTAFAALAFAFAFAARGGWRRAARGAAAEREANANDMISSVAVKTSSAIGADAKEEGERVEAILSAKRREREAERAEAKAPLAGASAERNEENGQLNRALIRESTERVDEEIIARAEEKSEEYPPELVEAMRRMEADVASGTFTEEALYAKYKDVLDAFGEEFEPTSVVDDDEEDAHPQLLDPWWWRNARALFLVVVAPAPGEPTEVFAMQMVPDNIPERARPEDRYHVVAFEDRRDAENFCYLMQSQRPREETVEELRVVLSMRAVGPKELQKIADDIDYGVTVVGAGRVDLSPHRPCVDVLNHIAHIGGEAYLWTFARRVKSEFDAGAAPR